MFGWGVGGALIACDFLYLASIRICHIVGLMRNLLSNQGGRSPNALRLAVAVAKASRPLLWMVTVATVRAKTCTVANVTFSPIRWAF